MIPDPFLYALAAGGLCVLLHAAWRRLRLSLAKHPSLQGHVRMARRVARQIPYYAYRGNAVYACDRAPADVVGARRSDFERLGEHFRRSAPRTLAAARALVAHVPDAAFTQAHRVPFQFREHVEGCLPVPPVIAASEGNRIEDLDGNIGYDLSGSYGVNVLGLEAYKACLARGFQRARALGPALGGYHPVVVDNAERLRRLSGLDAVSFHMSGTEAVMQAVGLARYHTGRRYLVRFAGAYHGWWDGVQVGVGSQRRTQDVLTLRERHEASLRVLRTRRDIAAVLVNPLQVMHPNRSAPGDATLVAGRTVAAADCAAHAHWLAELRAVCNERGIALIFDEIFSGFRLAPGGAQAYFGVAADLVTYGKSLGGGLPVGVLCGRERFMKRFRPERPADICFARGTFNAHPYVMTCMNEFLRLLESPEVQAGYRDLHAVWDRRTARLNEALAQRDLPVRLTNLASVLTVEYTAPSRYNWMFQFHLRAQGLILSWTGTGRLIMSHDYTDADFEAVAARFIAAAEAMRAAGWWWYPAGQTRKRIGRRILREMMTARLRGRSTPEPEPVAAARQEGSS